MHRFQSHIGSMVPLDKSARALRLLVAGLLCLSLVGTTAPGLASPAPTDTAEGRTAKELGIRLDAMPDVKMKAGVLMTSDGRILWARKPSNHRSIASITKIMTAVVAMEEGDLAEKVKIPKAARRVGESTSYLEAGDTLTLSELLEALLVKSGNDAAYAIAIHVAGSEEEFVKLMNAKAAELGLTNTRFTNSHGLDEGDQYSSAADVGVLSRYAMTKPEFRRIVAQKKAVVATSGRRIDVENTNLLIGNYEGANGVKTGWTDRAGYSVVDSAKRGDVELYAVILGTGTELQRFRDARELLDWGFAHYRPQQLVSAGTVVAEAPVADYLDETVGAQVADDQLVTVFDLYGPIKRTVKVTSVKAPVEKGDRVGVATFTQDGKIIATVPLVAATDVEAPNIFHRMGIGTVRLWRRVFGGQLVAPPVTASAVS